MIDRASEDIRHSEEEAEYRQQEAESLVEALRDREMFDLRDSDESLGRDKGVEESDIGVTARCGLADCDCEYTIGGLLRRLEVIAEQCTAGLHPNVDKNAVFQHIAYDANLTIGQARADCPIEERET